MRTRWSVELEGDGVLDLRVHRATGHLLVTTSKVTFRAAGQKRLTVNEVAPPTLAESVLIAKNGAIAARRLAGGAWGLPDGVNAGDAAPSVGEGVEGGDSDGSLPGGGVRIGSVDYSLTDGALSRRARDGELLSSVALPVDPLIAAMQKSGPAAVSRFERFSHYLKQTQPVAYDERRPLPSFPLGLQERAARNAHRIRRRPNDDARFDAESIPDHRRRCVEVYDHIDALLLNAERRDFCKARRFDLSHAPTEPARLLDVDDSGPLGQPNAIARVDGRRVARQHVDDDFQ